MIAMLAPLLPLAVFGLLLWFPGPKPGDLRDRFLFAALVWGALSIAVTEGLGLFSSLGSAEVAVAWVVLGALVWVVGSIRRRSEGQASAERAPPSEGDVALPAAEPARLEVLRPWRSDPLPLVGLGGVAVIAAAVGVIAILAPPNTWDSMTYHMSRVAQWAQQGSVRFYPTHIPRQLYYPPGAEFVILQLGLLSNTDSWANLVQWFAFVGCIVAATRIAVLLGAGARGQILAALSCATLPMAIAQASSTQNDLVTSFWVVSVAYWVLRWRQRPGWEEAAAVGTASGLALVTKFSGYLFVVPWAVWFVALAGRRLGLGAWRPMLAALACAAILNVGHLGRTYDAWRSARAENLELTRAPLVNETFGPAALVSNALRGVNLHLAGPLDEPNDFLWRAIRRFHRWMGINANDPRTTYPRRSYRARKAYLHEDVSGNPIQLVLIGTAVVATLWPGRRRARSTVVYLAAVAGGAVLFCLVLKWQPWHSRLQLPLFVLSAPLVGLSFERFSRRLQWLAVAVLLLAAVPALLSTRPRRLLGEGNVVTTSRAELLFFNRPDLLEPYRRAADHLVSRGCTTAGLVVGGNDWEYPFWRVMRDRAGDWPRIVHVAVENETRLSDTLDIVDSRPCGLFVIGGRFGEEVEWQGREFREGLRADPVRVFDPVDVQ